MLKAALYDVNGVNSKGKTRLCAAIAYRDYNAVRLLLQNGAVCGNNCTKFNSLLHLAQQDNVPLDLFDLLAKKWNFNTKYNYHGTAIMPLHLAVLHGCTENALRLIKLGARIDTRMFLRLPICYFFESFTSDFSNELFMRLLPSKAQGMDILITICKLLEKKISLGNSVIFFEMLHQLIQRLRFVRPLRVVCRERDQTYFLGNIMIINEVGNALDCTNRFVRHTHTPLAELIGVMLLALEFDFVATYTYGKRASLETVGTRHKVKSLQRLCILQVRNNMNSLDDNSFLSLPVPPVIQNFLALSDVSEEIFDMWYNQQPRWRELYRIDWFH